MKESKQKSVSFNVPNRSQLGYKPTQRLQKKFKVLLETKKENLTDVSVLNETQIGIR